MNLNLLILFPFLASLAVLLCREAKQVRWVALAAASLQVILCLALLYLYCRTSSSGVTDAMLFQEDRVWYAPLQIHYHTGVDGISVAMLLLTSLIVLAGVLVSWNTQQLAKEFFFLLLLLSVGAYGFFISLDLFTLFFFLELAVVPKFLLIGIWGSGNKTYSAMKLALMLMAGSALVFVGLAGVYFHTGTGQGAGSFDLLRIAQTAMPVETQKFFFPFVFAGFGIFAALFPFHTWVPDGHSSAPTAASMFLAGISMKLGGYGCLRVATFLLPAAANYYSGLIVGLSAIGILYGAFATMMQTDLKYMNAYSSVSHCGFVLLGIGMLTRTSITGAVMQMVSHGLMTALFFACIGMIYDRTHTRAVSKLGGLLKRMPFISTAFVLTGLCSLGLPGLSGFVAELTVFMGSWQRIEPFYRWATVAACCSIVVTAVYILRAAGQTIMGGPGIAIRENARDLKDAVWNERVAIAVLVIGIVAMGIAPFWLSDLVGAPADTIVNKLTTVHP